MEKMKFLTPMQKMNVIKGIVNNEEKYIDALLGELDRLENHLKNLELQLEHINYTTSKVFKNSQKPDNSI